MTSELLFGALPSVVAVGAVVVSWLVARRAHSIGQWCASALVFIAAAWSLVLVYRIVALGAWPTPHPYIAIGLATVIVIVQAWLLRRSRA